MAQSKKLITRLPVSSKSMRSIGFEQDEIETPGGRFKAKRSSSGTMDIEFPNGEIYRYKGVPQRLYRELIDSPSIGGFFQSSVRPFFTGDLVGRAGDDPASQNPKSETIN